MSYVPCYEMRFSDHEALLIRVNGDDSLSVRREDGLVLDQVFHPDHVEYPQWLDSLYDMFDAAETVPGLVWLVQDPWTGENPPKN